MLGSMPLGQAAAAALGQTWPPFALVTGLLLTGLVAHRDGVFASVAGWLARLPGGEISLYAVSMLVVAATTVVLNLDTSVAFLTPVLVQLARRRGSGAAVFVYGCVYMSNAASLLLPGSNLTNLLVFAANPLPGAAFARDMAAGWGAAVVVTGVLTYAVVRRWRDGSVEPERAATDVAGTGRLGWLAVAVVIVLVLVVPQPALPVLGCGVLVAAVRALRGELAPRAMLRAVNPLIFGGLFALACVLGTVARLWAGPAAVMHAASGWQTAGLGAVAAVAVNNLPAAVLLSAGGVPHARSLLLGLNLGPNLAVTGSLSAVIWMQVARGAGGSASPRRYTLGGLLLVPCSIAAALAAFSLSGTPRL
ncbi:MAG TPA: SLC13 family permease [Dehalococcoidia bacterium]|nr:SLC13 family permease [Dehalococcoidia bacterium]